MTKQSETSVKTVEKQNKPHLFQPGQSGNPNGRPKGSRDFSTMFEEAVKIIVKEQRIPVDNVEVELVVKGIVQAMRGNYSFWKDIMDRTYGSPNRSDTNVNLAIQNNITYTREDTLTDVLYFCEHDATDEDKDKIINSLNKEKNGN
jgi:hypothetical protein